MPRFIWFKPMWEPDTILDILAQIAAKRAGEVPAADVLVPSLMPHNVQLDKLAAKMATQNANAEAITQNQLQQHHQQHQQLQQQQQQQQPQPQQQQLQQPRQQEQRQQQHQQRGNSECGPGVANDAAPHAKGSTTGGRKARDWPCIFGCRNSSQMKQGKPVWKAVPSPSPWPDTPVGATLCKKCYDRTMKAVRTRRNDDPIERRGQHATHTNMSTDAERRETAAQSLVNANWVGNVSGSASKSADATQSGTADQFLFTAGRVGNVCLTTSASTDVQQSEVVAQPLFKAEHVGKQWLTSENPRSPRAKRPRCVSQRPFSGSSSSWEPWIPELTVGSKGTARQNMRSYVEPAGAVTFGDGGTRPPEPLLPTVVGPG